jgi:hypothetical protein
MKIDLNIPEAINHFSTSYTCQTHFLQLLPKPCWAGCFAFDDAFVELSDYAHDKEKKTRRNKGIAHAKIGILRGLMRALGGSLAVFGGISHPLSFISCQLVCAT